jgi:hypothetical protein
MGPKAHAPSSFCLPTTPGLVYSPGMAETSQSQAQPRTTGQTMKVGPWTYSYLLPVRGGVWCPENPDLPWLKEPC